MPYTWFEFMDDHTKNLAGLNFAFRNLLDSAAGGTFMEITLGEATKLLDNIMVNYSQWLTERSTNKKEHAIEEINVLSGKMDELMKLFASKSVSSDPNDIVFDPFMGSGSTGVACLNTNRDFIGIELDEKYFQIAKERINKAKEG